MSVTRLQAPAIFCTVVILKTKQAHFVPIQTASSRPPPQPVSLTGLGLCLDTDV